MCLPLDYVLCQHSAMLTQFQRWIHQVHRWLGLIVLLQVLFWSSGGLLMAFLDFSDLYVDPPQPGLTLPALSPQMLATRLQQAGVKGPFDTFQLVQRGGSTWFQVQPRSGDPLLVNSHGQIVSPISETQIRNFARSYYRGTGALVQLEKLSRSGGNYVSDRPLWRARFADAAGTEIYLEPQTGALLARRKRSWGIYHLMWELHLTKYTPWSSVNKGLMALLALMNIVVALTGLLKFFSPGRKRSPSP